MLNKKVIIVENEIIVADDISRLAMELGLLTYYPILNFKDAQRVFLEVLPDLIILDIRLEGYKSGLEFALWVRKSYQTPIVYLTVNDDYTTIERCKKTKPFQFLIKPFDDKQLKSMISLALAE